MVAEHLAWFATRPPDVGSLTRRVLARIAAGTPWTEAARRIWEERDTDTNAAVAGALLGARDGAAALPRGWLAPLRDREAIEAEARALVPLAGRGS